MEHAIADPVGTGPSRILITGAGGQLGVALKEVFPAADARTRDQFDITTSTLDYRPELVLHAAAWTDVDAAEDHVEQARFVNVEGTANVAGLGAPVVYFSTDYVFDGAGSEPYCESDRPNPLSVYGRTKLAGEGEIRRGWIVRSSWLFGRTGRNFVRTMLELATREDEVKVVADQRGSPTYVGHLAEAVPRVLELPYGTRHIAAEGDCTWAEFAEAIFEDGGVDCRVVPISTEELGRPAPRPAYSVLRSEYEDTPRLPHWRDGLRECLDKMNALR